MRDSFAPLTYASVTGSFASVSSNAQISLGPNGATMQVNGPNPPAPKARNISTRGRVETGENVLIGGFIISGSQPKKVIIRAVGPSLGAYGIADALADPVLDLHSTSRLITSNDNWRSHQEQEIIDSKLPPTSDLEAAIIATLEPGTYTAIMRGKDTSTGVGLVEVYDLDSGSPERLANISTRGQVQTGDNVMIGGFIIAGDYPAKMLIRAVGPSLTQYGVTGALQNPTLQLVDINGNMISNDNWRATQEAEITATTLPPSKRQRSGDRRDASSRFLHRNRAREG